MKFITATILLLLMLTQSFSKWMVVLEYELNKKFISEKLCVNKSKPSMHCNGRCYLVKKLISDEEQPQSDTHKIPVSKFVELHFTAPLADSTTSIVAIAIVASNSIYIASEYDSPLDPIFHPPSLFLLHA
ncbi:MAG TPA: hypothetical protein VHM26_13700 [Chitinophagaceae bacterium]|jgi:hypothetical protein|nr:hypothetical protein [Chitinophagaceae bacterium]